jgi:hypothetical protein
LNLYKKQNESGTFQLSARYGESQPNTNGFKNGGKKIEVTGKYTLSDDLNSNPGVKVYQLDAEKLSLPVLLAEMDSNILHFLDKEKKFITGNGGWGYVLNKLKK